MNEQNEPNENLEPSDADGTAADAIDATADEVIELPEIVEATAGDEVPADARVEAPAAAAPGVEVPAADTAVSTDKPKRRIGRLATVAAVAALLGIAGGAGAVALIGDGGHGRGGRGGHGDSHQIDADRHGDGHHGADGDHD